MVMKKKYSIIIFGASGFTGQYVVEELAKTLKQRGDAKTFKWAVAGRSISKLTAVLKQASDATGIDVNNIEKIEADVASHESLVEMAKQGAIILNCVGPYRFFGEQVVKACVEGGAHHVDISGEPQFLEKMQLLYHKDAEESGVYIVGSCGFDSIPTDCGVTFLQQKFGGDLNSVESYLESKNDSGEKSVIHYGTWQSAIYGLAHAGELRPLRQQLFPTRLPKPKYPLKARSVLHKSEIAKGWCLPFPGSDRSVVMRSQRYFYENDHIRPAQMQAYVKQDNLFVALSVMVVAIVFGVLAQFKCGRYLLENYPRLFSLGFVSHEGPSRHSADSTKFTFTLSGQGWAEKLSDVAEDHTEPPNKKMVVKVQGTNPGYGGTCTCLVQAALTILEETDKLPSKGGVYPPGSAFAKTTIVDRLNQFGVTFTVTNEEKL